MYFSCGRLAPNAESLSIFNVSGGTIGKSSEITISSSFTAEHAKNAEASENQSDDWNGLKTLRPPR